MLLGKLISVDRDGDGVSITIDAPGRPEYVVLVFDEDEAVDHVVEVLDKLRERARDRALEMGRRDLEAFEGERVCASLRPQPGD